MVCPLLPRNTSRIATPSPHPDHRGGRASIWITSLDEMSRHPPVRHSAGDAPPIGSYIPPNMLYPWPTGLPDVSRPGQYHPVHSAYFPSPQAHPGYAFTPPRFGFRTIRGNPPRRIPQKRFRGPDSPENPPHHKQFHRQWKGKASSYDRSLFDRDDPFYDKSMFEDPWKDFYPVSTEKVVEGAVCSDERVDSDCEVSLHSDTELRKLDDHNSDRHTRNTEVLTTCQD